MLYKKYNKLILLLSVILILFISIPSCIVATENVTEIESQETDLNEVNSLDSENIENSLEDSTNDDLNSDDYYFDIKNGNDNGDGTKNNPYKNLKKDRIFDNTNIHLANGEYEHTLLNSHTNISIYGEDATKTIINGNGGTLTIEENFILRDVTLYNITIINQAKLQAYNTIFTSSTYTYGGAINSDGYDVYLNNCVFKNCYAETGGAIYLKSANLDGDYVNFTSCNATFGGAILALETNTHLSHSNLEYNNAYYDGGTIYQLYGTLKIENSKLANNNAKNGGAIYSLLSENSSIINNGFNSNQAKNCGGSLFIDTYSGSIISNNFNYNHATNIGGAIYLISSPNATLNNNYKQNTALAYNDLYENQNILRFISSGNYTLYHINDSYDGEIPSKYDLREHGYITQIKDQKDGGNCWAFYSIASVESAILKLDGESLDLSEENMKNLMARYSIYGWDMETNDGGYDNMGIGYLVSWLGPIYEYEDEYNDESLISSVLNSIIHIQNVEFLKRNNFTDNNAIKEAILKYGAVGVGIYHNSAYRNSNNAYYYNGQNSDNHGVNIVGWDDNYSKNNFKNTPPGDGAWIVRNSWGTNWGDNGYFYVSYYDTKLAEVGVNDDAYVIILNDTLKYDKNYQYDIPGKTDYFLNSTNTAWYKNIFNSTDNEYLAAVSTYFQKDTNWTLTIKVNNILKYTQEGFSKSGYHTINLNQMIPLNIGDIFEVIFKITGDGETGIPISEKISLNNYFYKENISFLSYDGNTWTDLYQLKWTYPNHTYNSQVACIKAFTILNPVATTISLNLSNMNDNHAELIAQVYNQYGYLVNSGDITFTIRDNNQTVPVINGIAQLNITITNGMTITALFNAIGYQTSTISKVVFIPQTNTKIQLTISSNNNPITITAYVTDLDNNPVESGSVTFNTGSKNYNVNIVNGLAKLNNINLNIGTNTISAKYQDNFNYKPSNTSKTITVSLINTQIELTINSSENPYEIIAKLSDGGNNPINSGNIRFKLDDKEYDTTLTNGIAKITHIFTKIGTNTIYAYYDGNIRYASSNKQKSISVTKKEVGLNFNITTYGNEVTITTNIPNCLMEYTIQANINNKNYTAKSKNGKVTLDLTLENNEYTYKISLTSPIYKTNDLNGNFEINTVETKIISSDATICRNGDYSITLKDNNDNPLANKIVFLTIKEKTYRNRTNEEGIAKFNLKLDDNKYSATIKFLGDDNYLKSSVKKSITVKDSIIMPTKTQYDPNSVYEASLLNPQGNPLTNTIVNIKINENSYDVKTDSNGKLSLKLGQNKGLCTVIITNPVTGDISSQTIKITFKSKIIAYDATICRNGEYSITLKDESDYPIENRDVFLTINGRTLVSRTNNQGIAVFTINLDVNTYTVNIEFPDSESYSKSTLSTIITVKNSIILPSNTKYTLNSKYEATLLNTQGTPLINQEVSVILNGATHTLKTDANGKLRLNINLNPGPYSITINNPQTGDKSTQTIFIVSRILENKDITTYANSGTKYKVRAYDNYGNPVGAGQTVTFKIKNKKYYVKTNKNGYASLKLTQTPGKYTITATYNGYTVSNTINIKYTANKIISKNIVVKKGKRIKVKVKLLNKKGKVLKGKKLKFKFKGKTYKVKTSKKGVATLKIPKNVVKKLKVGTYKIKIYYGKTKVTKKIRIKK